MTAFLIKILASVCMLLDHVSEVFSLPASLWFFKSIGRIAFPIYAYMIAQGCKQTKNIKKYMIRLATFAFISEIPFDLTFHQHFGNSLGINFLDDTNVFYTLFLGVACITIYENIIKLRRAWLAFIPLLIIPFTVIIATIFQHSKIILSIGFLLYLVFTLWLSQHLSQIEKESKSSLLLKALSLITITPIFMLGSILNTDYGMYGIIYILIFYFTKPENRYSRTLAMIFVIFMLDAYPYLFYNCIDLYGVYLFIPPGMRMYNVNNLTYFWFALAAVVIVFIYNGKRGPKIRWLFYLFYPAHIALLSVIRFAISN